MLPKIVQNNGTGLSFANNDIELQDQNLDALDQLNKVYQEKWNAYKGAINANVSYLEQTKDMDINGSNKVHLDNAKNNFNNSIKQYVDEGNYEHAGKAVDEATQKLANDTAFQASLNDYKSYQAWASSLKEEQNGLLKNGKGAWTDEEQAYFRNYFRQAYKGVKKNDDGTVTSGF